MLRGWCYFCLKNCLLIVVGGSIIYYTVASQYLVLMSTACTLYGNNEIMYIIYLLLTIIDNLKNYYLILVVLSTVYSISNLNKSVEMPDGLRLEIVFNLFAHLSPLLENQQFALMITARVDVSTRTRIDVSTHTRVHRSFKIIFIFIARYIFGIEF